MLTVYIYLPTKGNFAFNEVNNA